MRCLGKFSTIEALNFPIYSAADIASGALMMPGVTAETDLGAMILADGACADAIGFMDGDYDFSEVGSSVVDGSAWIFQRVKPCIEATILRAEIDQSDTMAVAGYSTKTVTITSVEDNIDTSWVYCPSGDGIGQLEFVDTSASGSFTIATTPTVDFAIGDTMIKIPRIFHPLTKINAAATMFGTDAAAGSGTITVIRTFIERSRDGGQNLNPTKHDNLTGLNASSVAIKFYADFFQRNTSPYTID